jgi:hypothetical protein
LYIASVETFGGGINQNIQLPNLDNLYSKYASDFNAPMIIT